MGNSILEQFRAEYERDMESIRRGEKAPTDDMNDIEKEGRELANKIWANSKLNENPDKDKPHYTTNDLRRDGKLTETPIPNVVVIKANCPDCGREITTKALKGKYKCPKCGKEYILDMPYPHFAVKLPDGNTLMIDPDSLQSNETANPHLEDRDEPIPSFDEIPECPNWDDPDCYNIDDPYNCKTRRNGGY